MRFKIDVYGGPSFSFGLFVRRGWFRHWDLLQNFQTREDALAYYEKIKSLPEFLP